MSTMSTRSDGIDVRTTFMRLSPASRTALSEAWAIIQPSLDQVLTVFYDHLKRTPETAALLEAQARRGLDGLKDAQRKHWERLFTGSFGADYVAGVRRVGEAHARIGLDPRWYLGGYALALAEMGRLVGAKHRWNGRHAAEVMAAVTSAVFLDMDLALSVYFEEAQAAAAAERGKVADAFDAVVAMDSLIHYEPETALAALASLAERTDRQIVFTFAPWSPALGLMHRVGKLFPRGDKSPAIVPVRPDRIADGMAGRLGAEGWRIGTTKRISSGFYTSQMMEVSRA